MTITRYTIGFILSLLLSLAAYYYVVLGGSETWFLPILGMLAITQMVVQLIFFLHLGEEVRPRYRLASFGFMLIILIVVVVGSLWVMVHLNENMMHMSPDEKTNYMMTQHDKGF